MLEVRLGSERAKEKTIPAEEYNGERETQSACQSLCSPHL